LAHVDGHPVVGHDHGGRTAPAIRGHGGEVIPDIRGGIVHVGKGSVFWVGWERANQKHKRQRAVREMVFTNMGIRVKNKITRTGCKQEGGKTRKGGLRTFARITSRPRCHDEELRLVRTGGDRLHVVELVEGAGGAHRPGPGDGIVKCPGAANPALPPGRPSAQQRD
jgi:hypothetical protein